MFCFYYYKFLLNKFIYYKNLILYYILKLYFSYWRLNMDEYLIKSKSETNPEYGCNPYERPIDEHIAKGIINLDKPSGPTSHEVDSWVKRILGCNKTGHGGTLDPKVTGVLPIGIDNATRVSQLLLPAGKEYVCLMHLHREIPEDQVKAIFDEFTGIISGFHCRTNYRT